jgi:hypothetical protein
VQFHDLLPTGSVTVGETPHTTYGQRLLNSPVCHGEPTRRYPS